MNRKRHTPVLLPAINEDSEKNDDRIQDLKKALDIEKEENHKDSKPLRVRSAQNAENDIDLQKELPAPKRAPGKNPLLRTNSERNLEWGRGKRQGPGFMNSQRARTGILSTRQKLFGFGQRKVTSPRIDNGRQKLSLNDVPDTIDLTKHEHVRTILQRFYVQDLKMDSSDPRLEGSEDYINSLRAKSQRKFSIGELWHNNSSANGRKSKNPLSSVDDKKALNRLRKEQAEDSPSKIFSRTLEKFELKPTFDVSYARPMTLTSLQTGLPETRKALTSSFQEQPNDVRKYTTTFREQPKTVPKQRKGRFLRPIKQKRKSKAIALLK